jgi:hypothetical protein
MHPIAIEHGEIYPKPARPGGSHRAGVDLGDAA